MAARALASGSRWLSTGHHEALAGGGAGGGGYRKLEEMIVDLQKNLKKYREESMQAHKRSHELIENKESLSSGSSLWTSVFNFVACVIVIATVSIGAYRFGMDKLIRDLEKAQPAQEDGEKTRIGRAAELLADRAVTAIYQKIYNSMISAVTFQWLRSKKAPPPNNEKTEKVKEDKVWLGKHHLMAAVLGWLGEKIPPLQRLELFRRRKKPIRKSAQAPEKKPTKVRDIFPWLLKRDDQPRFDPREKR